MTLETNINATAQLAVQLLRALQQRPDEEYVEVTSDLATLCRTLVTLSRRLQYGYTFSASDVQTLMHWLQVSKSVLAPEEQSVAQLESSITATCSGINRVITDTKYVFALPVQHTYYPWGDLVQRTHQDSRYDLRDDCVLETDLELAARINVDRALRETLQASECPVYEHVGRLDGGERMYDPFFLSRSPEQAWDFFTPGRVFSMLWSIDGYEVISHGIAHYDYSIEADRYSMVGFEGLYSGPYQGPTTARYFLVIRGGRSSTLCLPIVTLQYLYHDTQRYARITMSKPQSEQHQGVQIQIIPKPYYEPGPKRQTDIPPPHLIPSSDLPLPCSEKVASNVAEELAGQRTPFAPVMSELEKQSIKQLIDREFYVDLKRIVEVESGVKVRNIGMINQSEAWTQMRALFATLSL